MMETGREGAGGNGGLGGVTDACREVDVTEIVGGRVG